MNNSLEYDVSETGLGTMICLLSTFLHTPYQIIINTNRVASSLFSLKKIFNISDDQLIVKYTPNLTNDIIMHHSHQLQVSDIVKLFAPYFEWFKLSVLGNCYSLGNQGKPCIALLCYNNYDSLVKFNPASSGYPDNRYHGLNDYSRLFELIKSAGYEVVTLDNVSIDLEQKVYVLNQMCDAVIGYEGGLCHLAHLLKIPTILLPYRYQANQFKSTWNPYLNLLHLDKRTYFVDSMNEIWTWTADSLRTLIYNLYQDAGNNLFLSSELDVAFAHDLSEVSIYSPKLDVREISDLPITRFEHDFYHRYVGQLRLFTDQEPRFYKKQHATIS